MEGETALTDRWEFLAIDANHPQCGDLASPAEVEQRQADDTDLLVRTGGTAAHEAGGVLTRPHLESLVSSCGNGPGHWTLQPHHQHIQRLHRGSFWDRRERARV